MTAIDNISNVDKKLKVFVIRCFELLLLKMLPNANNSDIVAASELAENAMTKVANLAEYEELRDVLYAFCPLSENDAVALHKTVCSFAPNIVGAIMQKQDEIVNGTYTAEIFFGQPNTKQ